MYRWLSALPSYFYNSTDTRLHDYEARNISRNRRRELLVGRSIGIFNSLPLFFLSVRATARFQFECFSIRRRSLVCADNRCTAFYANPTSIRQEAVTSDRTMVSADERDREKERKGEKERARYGDECSVT